ncbi:MAG: hypothetical protein RL653_4160 [Pseudomonadota bacterium]|jgi:hypothetical protein
MSSRAALLVSLLFSAGVYAETAAFEFRLLGTPVGRVELQLEKGKFTYRSRQWFNRGGRESLQGRAVTLPATRAPRPASLLFWHKPGDGCRKARDELTGKVGRLCAELQGTKGEFLGSPWEATYSGKPLRLETLRLGDAEYVRLADEEAKAPAPPDFSGEGFRVDGYEGRPQVDPPVKLEPFNPDRWSRKQAQGLAEKVHAGSAGTSNACLELARAFRAEANKDRVRAEVVTGLLVEGDRALPHAWVRVITETGPLELDPSSMEPVTPERYVTLFRSADPADDAAGGKVFLDLLAGRRGVVRK